MLTYQKLPSLISFVYTITHLKCSISTLSIGYSLPLNPCYLNPILETLSGSKALQTVTIEWHSIEVKLSEKMQ